MHERSRLFRPVINDNSSGSAAILKKTEEALLAYCGKGEGGKAGLSKKGLIPELVALHSAHPQLLLLFHFLNELLLFLEAEPREEVPASALREWIMAYRDHWQKATRQMISRIRDIIQRNSTKAILLHSNSGSLQAVFDQGWQLGKLVIYQTVSHPVEEGKRQAAVLLSRGYRVCLLEEAAVAAMIGKIDMAILGTDAIREEAFLNKIGSGMIAREFKDAGKACWVLGDHRKLVDPASLPEQVKEALLQEQPKNPAEIWSDPPRGLEILNRYFEWTETRLVSGFILGDGHYRPAEIPALLKEKKLARTWQRR